MIPNFSGASAQNSTANTSGNTDQHRDRTPPSDEQPEKLSPRMVQSPPKIEEDGMEVDNPDDERARIEDRGRPPKRGRETDTDVEDVHSEPKLKRPRITTPTSPEPGPSDLHLASSSSSSSSSSTAFSTSSSSCVTSSPGVQLIRKTLDHKDALEVHSPEGPNIKQAARLLFGETTTEWPAGYSLIQIAGLSPELEQLLSESGVCVLWNGSEQIIPPGLLLLVTPESDRELLRVSLLQLQANEQVAEASDDDNDDNSDIEEEFRQFTIGKRCTALMLAAALGDDALMHTLLNNGADPNKRAPNGATALIVAAHHGQVRAVRTLLHAPGTMVDLKNVLGHNALSVAAARGNLDICSLLLGFGSASLDRQGPMENKHPLLAAARNGHYRICELIIKHEVGIDIEDREGRTALWHAVESGQIECCQWLLKAGANANHMSFLFGPMLEVAVHRNDLGLLNLLLGGGAELTPDTSSRLLCAATRENRIDMIKRLIELGIDINATHKGQTALSDACKAGHTEATRTLLEAGADPDIRDASGRNALFHAAKEGHVDILNLLIEYGTALRSKWHFGYHALYKATQHGQLDAMKTLLSANAPTSIPMDKRRHREKHTPLLTLVMNKEVFPALAFQRSAFQLLFEHGARWQEVDSTGNDVLMRAATWDDTILLWSLFQAGATVGQKNAQGLNALEIAARRADLALAAEYGPLSPDLKFAIPALVCLMDGARRQPNWIALRTEAIGNAQNPITREILCQGAAPPNQPFDFVIRLISDPLNVTCTQEAVESALQGAIDDWDRRATEIWLAQLGAPIPAIDFYCACIEAFPVIEVKLFGPDSGSGSEQNRFSRFFWAITANMEKLLFAEHGIEDAYEQLRWDGSHQVNLVYVARRKISEVASFAIEKEQSLQTAFSQLFDDCLQSTLSALARQMLPVHTPPAPGMIAAELMQREIYAALAEGIEEAWRIAWTETVKAAPATSSSSSSSSASSNEFSSQATAVAQLASVPDTLTGSGSGQLSELQAAELLSAFRKALSTIVDSASLLKLPGASPETAGLYADLMHRQLHMLVQFIRGETEVEVAVEPAPATVAAPTARALVPAPVAAPVATLIPAAAPAHAPAPTDQPELLELQAPAEWYAFDDWLPYDDWS